MEFSDYDGMRKTDDVPKAANRTSISVAVAKALLELHVEKNERQKVWQVNGRNEMEILGALYHKIPELSQGLQGEDVINTNSYVFYDLYDYYTMCSKLNICINLRISSRSKLHAAHNEIVPVYYEKMAKRAGKSRMTVHTQYLNDLKTLPDEFELIRTGKRLFVEGQIMHHCVYSYLDKVNKGKCVIFHLEYEGHYTVEVIKQQNGKYKCRQLYGPWDSAAPKSVWTFCKDNLARISASGEKAAQ